MSYEIIRSISCKNGKVIINSAESNVRPRSYVKYEYEELSKILQEKGREAVDVEILKRYENGDFQGGKNKYTKALEILRHLEEYKKFDWRDWNNNKEEIRKSKEFEELLKKVLKMDYPKNKFVVYKYHCYKKVYGKFKKHSIYWTNNINEATNFYWLSDIENLKKRYISSNNWEIEVKEA